MKGKRGIVWDHLIPWLIAIIVLVVIVVFAYLLRDQLIVLGDYLKNLFR